MIQARVNNPALLAVLAMATMIIGWWIVSSQVSHIAHAQNPGDYAVAVAREGDNQAVSGLNVIINCPNGGAPSIVPLTEAPTTPGLYEASLIGQCQDNDPIQVNIQGAGYVDQGGLNGGNWLQAQTPDCLLNQNCLPVNNFQFGHRFNVTDADSGQPVSGASINPAAGSCLELTSGSYFCAIPETVGCPKTSPFTASGGGYASTNGNYNDRCNSNDAQVVTAFTMTFVGGLSPQKRAELNAPAAPSCLDPVLLNPDTIQWNFLTNGPASSFELRAEDGTVIQSSIQDLLTGEAGNIIESGVTDTIVNRHICALGSGGVASCNSCDPFDQADLPLKTPTVDIEITELKLVSVEPIQVCPAFGTSTPDLNTQLWDLHSNLPNQDLPLLPNPANPNDDSGLFNWMNPDGTTGRLSFNVTSSPPLLDVEYSTFLSSGPKLNFVQSTYSPTEGVWQRVETTEEKLFDSAPDLPDPLSFFINPLTACSELPAPPAPSEEQAPDESSRVIATPDGLDVSISQENKAAVNCPENEAQSSVLLSVTETAGLISFDLGKINAPGIKDFGSLPLDLFYFIACDDDTNNLGLGERIGVVNTFTSLFGHVPVSEADWIDVLALANGATPQQEALDRSAQAEDDFRRLFGRSPDRSDPRDAESLNRLMYGMRPVHRDLEAENQGISKFISTFGRNPSTDHDWNVVRAVAYSNGSTLDLNEVDETIAEGQSLLEGDDPCPPEYVEKLKAQKAALEAEAASLEKEQAEIKEEQKMCNDKKNSIQDKINDANSKIDSTNKEIDENKKAQDENQKDIENLEKDIDDLQKILTGGDKVSQKSGGGDPLSGISSGAAVSFDGGTTWIVAEGEEGASQLSEALENNPGIVEDLNQKKNDLKDAREKADDLKNKNEQLNKDKEKAEKDKEAAENELEAKEKELKQKQEDFDAIGDKIDELNAKIAAFNDIAKECNVKAEAAARAASERLNEAKDKLDNMPPDLKEEAEDEFENTATEEEQNADTDAGYAGGVADSAAEKLEEAMRNASGCPEGDKRCGESYSTTVYVESGAEGWFQTLLFLRGGGLDADEKYRDMVQGIQDSFSDVDNISKIGEGLQITIDVMHGASALKAIGLSLPGFVYGLWQDIATQAILNEISRIRNTIPNPAIDGDIHVYGMWDKFKTNTYTKVYVCKDGIYQYDGDQLSSTKTSCELTDAYQRINIPDSNLPDYTEQEDGNWSNPDSLNRFYKWRAGVLDRYRPFQECKESFSEFSIDC